MVVAGGILLLIGLATMRFSGSFGLTLLAGMVTALVGAGWVVFAVALHRAATGGRLERIRQSGRATTGKMLEVRDTGWLGFGTFVVARVRLELHLPDGDAYTATTLCRMSRADMATLLPGSYVPVRVAVDAPRQVALA